MSSLLLLTIVLAAPPFDIAIDIPATLSGTTFRPDQLVRSNANVYSTVANLPTGTFVSAVHRYPNGSWLLAPAHPFRVGPFAYEPRDIVAFDGVSFSMWLDGDAIGAPADAAIDAIFLDGSGAPVLSFDAPVSLGAVTYGPSDLIRCQGGCAVYWSGVGHGVPSYSNVVGAALDGQGRLLLTFDVPTRLGIVNYMPGELVLAQGSTYSSYAKDPAWPPDAMVRDFAILPPSGSVPESGGPGQNLRLSKSGASQVTLQWGASCVGSDTDFSVHEGSLAAPFASHTPRTCSTSGSTTWPLTPSAGSRYFLVVPHNAVSEGSYGVSSSGTERSASGGACLPQSVGACGSP